MRHHLPVLDCAGLNDLFLLSLVCISMVAMLKYNGEAMMYAYSFAC